MGTATQGREASGRARRQRAMADPDGGRTTYSYDGANRVTSHPITLHTSLSPSLSCYAPRSREGKREK